MIDLVGDKKTPEAGGGRQQREGAAVLQSAMDDQTALVLALQLTALCCIAGSLLLYLVWKVRRSSSSDRGLSGGKSVLVTAAGSQLGLEVVLRLAQLGFRVFAGLHEPDGSPAKVLKAKVKQMEAEGKAHGAVVLMPLDCTREDSLHEAVDHVRRHLPAGQNGLWAVVNTAGYACKGRLEAQESAAWELMFRVNVVATLRTARALLPLLRVTQGRLVTLGLTGECCADGSGAVAYSAARHAVAGCSSALRQEIQPTGVSVIVVDAPKIRAETLYRPVRPKQEGGVEAYTSYRTDLLPEYFLSGLEEVLLSNQIKERYELRPPVTMSSFLQQRRKSNSHSTV